MTNETNKSVALTKCFECREILKSNGGKWDGSAWVLTKAQFDAVDAEIEALRSSTGKSKVAIVKSWDKAEGRWFVPVVVVVESAKAEAVDEDVADQLASAAAVAGTERV